MGLTMRRAGLAGVLMLCLSVSFIGAVATPNEGGADTAAIEKAVKETYAEITKAAENMDAETLFGFVLENEKGCQITSGSVTLTRRKAMEEYRNNIGGIAEIEYSMDRQYVTVISPETAVMVAEGRFEARTTDGRTFGSPMAQTVIFVLNEGGWKVLHSHTSVPRQ